MINSQKTITDPLSPSGQKAVLEKDLLKVEGLRKYFPIHKGFFNKVCGYVKAVDNVSFSIAPATTYSLVGESGCGKTTIGRSILNLIEPTAGDIYFNGVNLNSFSEKEFRKIRKKMQIIFQDPFSSLNARHTIFDIISEGIKTHFKLNKKEIMLRVKQLLEDVGLEEEYLNRYPHEFSGGQRQRIAIARALAVDPEFIVCDESVSALDVSIQAQIINLLQDLQKKRKIAYLFITHDLAVVRHISDKVGVMYLGQIMEEGLTDEIFESPQHPYTKALMSAIPIINPEERRHRIILEGEIPSAANPPSGCPFHTRCPDKIKNCEKVKLPVKYLSKTHKVRCIHF